MYTLRSQSGVVDQVVEKEEKDTEEGRKRGTKKRIDSESKGFYRRSYCLEAKLVPSLACTSVCHSAVPQHGSSGEAVQASVIEVDTQWVVTVWTFPNPCIQVRPSRHYGSCKDESGCMLWISWLLDLHHQTLDSFALPFTPSNKHR